MNTITDLDKSIAVAFPLPDQDAALPSYPSLLRYELTTINRLTLLQTMRPEWDALVAASDDAPFYLTYSYCEEVAAKLFAKSCKLIIVQVFADDDLIALWPFAIERRGIWRVATHLSCGDGEEYCRPLIKSNVDQNIVTKTAVSAAMKIPADVLELHYVEEGSHLHDALDGKSEPRFLPKRLGRWGASSIALRQFDKIDDYYQHVLSSGLRRNLKRQMKALQAQGKIEIGWCASADETRSVLQWLFENKRHWAKSRGIVTPWLQADYVLDFHASLAHKIDLTKTPLVAYIKCDGVPIAASVSWIGNRVHEWCITTYDEGYHRFGVGVLLLEFLVKWSHAQHLDFDFRFFEADYKDRWATQHTTQKMRHVFLNRFGKLHEIQMFTIGAIVSLIYRRRRLMQKIKERKAK